MTTTVEPTVNWSQDQMVEVFLNEPDDFLKVRETLTRIGRLLCDWGLVSVLDEERVSDIAPLNQIKVLAYKDKGEWILEQKYNIGKKTKPQETSE